MIHIFFYLGLVPPFSNTNISEIGNWSLKGSSTNLKSYIRLTNSIPNDQGRVCSILPSFYRDWDVEISMIAHGGNGGRGIWISYTSEVCPMIPSQWDGFIIWINSSRIDSNGLSPLFFCHNINLTKMPSDYTEIGNVSLRNISNPLILSLIRRNDTIEIRNEQKSIFKFSHSDMIHSGYFTIAAMTSKTWDNNDLRYFKFIPQSQIILSKNLAHLNRKIIDGSYHSRKEKKKIRREDMSYATMYNLEAVHKKFIADGIDIEFSDSMNIINEAKFRSEQSISLQELMIFIDDLIGDRILQAYKKIKDAGDEFSQIKSTVSFIWSDIKNKLIDMSEESQREMFKIREEITQMFNKSISSDTNIKPLLRYEANKITESVISQTLYYIALFELFTYIIFFVIKRRETKGFKKRD